MINRFFQSLTFVGAAAIGLSLGLSASTTEAQSLSVSEQTTFYASVRGWDVHSFRNTQTGNMGCRAIKYENGQPIVLNYMRDSAGRRAGQWQVVTTTRQGGTFAGGILGIDKADIDSQFGFNEGWASMDISSSVLQRLKAGSQLAIEINGDPVRYFSLRGSTAASLKAQECLDDPQPQRAVQQAQATPAARAPAAPRASQSNAPQHAGLAHALSSNEQTTFYASVRGWDVYTFKNTWTGDGGCRAIKYENGVPLVLNYVRDSSGRSPARWQVVTTTRQGGTFAGGILGIDKADIDSQFGFNEGWASMDISPSILQSIKAGSQLAIEINGDPVRYFSLRGSTAASLKAQECLEGPQPQRAAQQAQTAQVPSAPAVPTVQQPATQQPPAPASVTWGAAIETIIANCDDGYAVYRCSVSQIYPDGNYLEVYMVDDARGANASTVSKLFKVRQDNFVDVWWIAPGEAPFFSGIYRMSGAQNECAESLPANQQPRLSQIAANDGYHTLCIR